MDVNLSRYAADHENSPVVAGSLGEKRMPIRGAVCCVGRVGVVGRVGRVGSLLLLSVLAACVSPNPPQGRVPVIEQSLAPPTQPAEPETPLAPPTQPTAPTAPDSPAIAHALAPEPGISVAEDPRTLADQAKQAPTGQAVPLLLQAITGYIRLGEFADAQTLIARLYGIPLSAPQQAALLLRQVYLAQAQGRHASAIEWLRELEQSPSVDAQSRARLLLRQVDSQLALGRKDAALETLLRLDRWLESPARIANQQRILELIRSLDPLGRLLLREESADDAMAGWVALSEVLGLEPPEAQMMAIRQWRARYRNHPAEARLLNPQLAAGGSGSTRHRRIALLLPLTSPFGQAARAFYEGFIASRNDDLAGQRPEVSLYDVGQDPLLVPLYYQAAINDGSDFVVGPLGRKAVDALLAGAPPQLPMLMIGAVPEDKTAPNLYGIGLSPEQEARQVALRAFADGHRQAGILRSNSLWGVRVSAAFARQWEALGGTLVGDPSIPGDIAAYPQFIRKFLGLDKSVVRERRLSAQLEIDLVSTPRRRDDVDFLFLAANADQARQLVPQLRFFQAHDLALYATSYIYSGTPDPATDADLDGVAFGDMDWMLDAAVLPEPEPEPAPAPGSASQLAPGPDARPGIAASLAPEPAPESLPGSDPAQAPQPAQPPAPQPPASGPEPGPYYHNDLDRLYALGLDSYLLIPRLNALRSNPRQRYFGKAVDLSVQADGNAWRHLTWARFEQGLPVPLPGITAVDLPPPIPLSDSGQ